MTTFDGRRRSSSNEAAVEGGGRAGAGPTTAALPKRRSKGAEPGRASDGHAEVAEGGPPPTDLATAAAAANPEAAVGDLKAALAGGKQLPAEQRARFEAMFGQDLSQVRIAEGGAAGQAATGMGAAAFALGGDIGFADGAYRPGTPEGDALLAHELAHVLQASARGPTGEGGGPAHSDAGGAHEAEANQAAQAAHARAVTAPEVGGDPRAKIKASLPDGEQAAAGARMFGEAEPGFEIRQQAEADRAHRCVPGCNSDSSKTPAGPAYAPAAVTPNFTVTETIAARSNSASSTTSTDDPTFTGHAAVDTGASAWRYQLDTVAGTGRIKIVYYTDDHYPAPTPTDDSGALTNVTAANWKDVVKGLKDDREGIASFWSAYRAEVLHERYHWQTEWQGEVKKEVVKAEAEIAKLSVSFADAATQSDAEAKLLPQVQKIWKDAMTRARAAYDALPDTPGSAPYKAQAPAMDALRARVEAHAAAQGWP